MKKGRNSWRIAAAGIACVALACEAAPCVRRMQGEAGRGDDVDVLGIAWDQPVGTRCEDEESRQFHLLWRIDRWKARRPEPAITHVWDASVLRTLRGRRATWRERAFTSTSA